MIPGPGRFHMPHGRLGPGAATTETLRLKPVLRKERSPYTAAREIPHTAAKTQ